jgi:hypothetical protein
MQHEFEWQAGAASGRRRRRGHDRHQRWLAALRDGRGSLPILPSAGMSFHPLNYFLSTFSHHHFCFLVWPSTADAISSANAAFSGDVMLHAMRHEFEGGQLRSAASIAEKAAPYVHGKMAPRAEDGGGEVTIVINGGLPR